MKYIFCFTFVCITVITAAQTKPVTRKTAAISIGRTAFGTGDILGLGVVTEFSKKISKRSKPFFGKLLLGAEIKFEAGAKQPKVINPTPQEFLFA